MYAKRFLLLELGMEAMANPEMDLLVELYDVGRHMRTYADKLARRHGMTRARWVVLSRLERQPGLSQNELAAIAEASPVTIGRLIDRLEEQGLVERCSDPADRRVRRLRLKPAADPVLQQLEACRSELHASMVSGIDPAVLAALTTGLRQMKENIISPRKKLRQQLAASREF